MAPPNTLIQIFPPPLCLTTRTSATLNSNPPQMPERAQRSASLMEPGMVHWRIGAVDSFLDRTAMIGSRSVAATIACGYSDWTRFYIANREESSLLRLFKRTHLKDTKVALAVTSPKKSLNLFRRAKQQRHGGPVFQESR
jgi:hypothetical protein